MKALILAAGYATRLYPLTKHFPKPLLKVGKKPLINYILDKLDGLQGIDEIIVVTNSRFIDKFRQWKRRQNTRCRITLVDDLTSTNETRLGAIGDMAFVIRKKRIRSDLLVVGGDNLFDGGLQEFLDFAAERKSSPVIGAYDISSRENASKYGVLEINKRGRIVDFQEKPARPRSSLVGMCLYYFPKEKLGLFKEYFSRKRTRSDATGFYIDWLRKRVAVYACVFRGHWYDIGDFGFYNKANQWIAKAKERK